MARLGARCPNHKVRLIATTTKGIGICPISGYRFAYHADESKRKRKMDLIGNVVETNEWIVEGNEEDVG